MLNKLRNRRGGFTLVEIIISIGVLGIVSVLVVQMFIQSMNLTDKARDMDNASCESQMCVEYYKVYGTLDVASVQDKWGLLGQYLREDGGTDTLEIHYNSDWEQVAEADPQGFTLEAIAAPAQNGLSTIEVYFFKNAGYRLESEGRSQLFYLRAVRPEAGGALS